MTNTRPAKWNFRLQRDGVTLSPQQLEELAEMAPDVYQAELIRITMSRGQVVVIARYGSLLKEERLANWIRRHGGKAQIVSELIAFPKRSK